MQAKLSLSDGTSQKTRKRTHKQLKEEFDHPKKRSRGFGMGR
ncbi:hypothetical protein [Bacteroides thetaiotaomicron]|nr:hypothetical protein [Bacteroides thetaiotaomicron]